FASYQIRIVQVIRGWGSEMQEGRGDV
ncbi:antibiotic biosynthesis monooxygenase, partial [Raoultella planticola]